MAKYKVAKIGWENENPFIDVLLISKSEREKQNIDLHSPVNVKKGKIVQIAIVDKQFRELIGKAGVCTVNQKLAKTLKLKIGSVVELENGVTESQFARYQTECRHVEVAGVV